MALNGATWPLSRKILGLALLNLALIAAVLVVFAQWQFGLSIESLVLGPARDRIVAIANAIGRDASRAAALATAQVERADRALNDLAVRLDHTLRSFQAILDGPVREGHAIVTALAAALRAMRGGGARRARGEEEDALFI